MVFPFSVAYSVELPTCMVDFVCQQRYVDWQSVVLVQSATKIIRALAIVLVNFLSFDCQFLLSHACIKKLIPKIVL